MKTVIHLQMLHLTRVCVSSENNGHPRLMIPISQHNLRFQGQTSKKVCRRAVYIYILYLDIDPHRYTLQLVRGRGGSPPPSNLQQDNFISCVKVKTLYYCAVYYI